MAQDITLDFSFTPAVVPSFNPNSLGDAGSATSGVIDLGAQAPHEITFEATLDGNSASNTGYVEWHMLWSQDGTDFTDENNAQFFHATKMNGVTVVRDVFSCPVKERYCKVFALNNSGDALAATGNALLYREVAVDQA